MKMSSKVYTNMSCGLKLDTQSPGWYKTITKVFKKIDGVKYVIDQDGMAYVTGRVDPNKLLKKIAKAGKHAVLCWVETGNQNPITNPHHHYATNGGAYQQYHHPAGYAGAYPNYYQQGYEYPYHGYGPYYSYPAWV